MARYIDATRLQAKILDASIKNKLSESREVLKIFDKMVQDMPTADVVPKSEYDEVLSSWQKIHDSYDADCIEHYKYGRAEVAREIFEEIDSLFDRYYNDPSYSSGELGYDIAELKKKYTDTSPADPKEAFIQKLVDNWQWGEDSETEVKNND